MDIAIMIQELRDVKTMPGLNNLRGKTFEAMGSGSKETFDLVQGEFRKAKNRLERIPLSQRTW